MCLQHDVRRYIKISHFHSAAAAVAARILDQQSKLNHEDDDDDDVAVTIHKKETRLNHLQHLRKLIDSVGFFDTREVVLIKA